MKKVLVSIYVLRLDRTFDVEIPINLSMSDVLSLLQDSIKEMSNGAYQVNSNARLYESHSGNLLNPNNIVKYSGIKNGGKLLLV